MRAARSVWNSEEARRHFNEQRWLDDFYQRPSDVLTSPIVQTKSMCIKFSYNRKWYKLLFMANMLANEWPHVSTWWVQIWHSLLKLLRKYVSQLSSPAILYLCPSAVRCWAGDVLWLYQSLLTENSCLLGYKYWDWMYHKTDTKSEKRLKSCMEVQYWP